MRARGARRARRRKPQAQPAAEMLVGLGVRLVAHRLRAAARGQEARLCQLGERGVDGATAELGTTAAARAWISSADRCSSAPWENAPRIALPLRGDPQPARAQEFPGVLSEKPSPHVCAPPVPGSPPNQDTVLLRSACMIMRIDRLQTEMPPPSTPDPAGAAVVQELLGGKFGEMSTFMNYTFQSFNFRNRQGARPVLRPGREHRRRGVRPHRARLDRDQHDAHRRRREGRAARARRAAQPAALHRRRRGRARPGLQRQALERRLRHLDR